MNIAYITTSERGKMDVILSQVASQLADQGMRLVGVVQTNSDCPNEHHCDMDVAVLPDGPTIRISQSLGREARGCRLDTAALEQSVMEVQARLSPTTDLLILNKFGKHEAEGRGFRDVIAEALSQGIPVLTTVNHLNEKAFLSFTGGLATKLPTDIISLMEWALANTASCAEID